MNRRTFALAALATLCTATVASAHPGHGEHGLVTGLAHPVGGLDHLLAMVSVGLLAFGLGKRALWLLPLTFVGFMTLGALGGSFGYGVPTWAAENGIAASVVVIGLLITLGSRIPLSLATVAAALFAVCHGSAHAAEMPAGQSAVGFFAGFVVSTMLLHVAGIGLGLLAAKLEPATRVSVAH